MDLKQINIQSMGHLGVIAALLSKYDIAGRIDKLIPLAKDERTNTSHGQRVCAMVLNAMGFINSPLYMTPEFFKDKPVELLLGEGVTAEMLNEDALGRCLDALYEHGTTRLFTRVAFEIVKEQGLLGKHNHLDSTSMMLFGQYDSDKWEGGPNPAYGFSKDHRPDLKQILVSIITNGPAGVPLFYQANDGNASDKTTFHESIALMRSFYRSLEESDDMLWVADSALYNGQKLSETTVDWLTLVPKTLKKAKEFVSSPASSFKWIDLGEGYHCAEVKGPTGEYWKMYQSQKGKASQLITLNRKITQEFETKGKALKKLTGETFGCKEDARKALKALDKKLKYHRAVELEVVEIKGCDKPGRPKAGKKKVKGYDIKAELVEDKEAIEAAKEPLGRFILATNVKDVSATDTLEYYKQQRDAEDGFRYLKDKSFQNNRIFLKNPQRIDALMMVMTLSLLVYNLGQYGLRQNLKDQDESVPNQKGKPTQSPTLRWVFQMLSGISVASLPGQAAVIANIGEREAHVIRMLGAEAMAIYKLS